MPKRTYALEVDGEKRLEIDSKVMWKGVTVRLDGNEVGSVPDQESLTNGQEILLPDGSKLWLELKRGFFNTELNVLRNGKPLPGSPSDPLTRVKSAYQIVFFIAAINIVFGLLATFVSGQFFEGLGLSVSSIIFGLLFLALGFFIRSKSKVALIVAIVAFGLDTLFGIYLTITNGASPSVSGLLIRILLFIPMFQAIGAIDEAKSA